MRNSRRELLRWALFARAAFFDRDAACLELGRELATDANTERESATGEDVERGRDLRAGRRVAEREEVDRRPELDGLCDGGREAEQGEGLDHGDVERDVVADPGRVEACRFEGRGQLTLALAKEENATWKQLCPAAVEGERRGSVSTWFEMQESIDKEEKKEKKQAEKKKDAEKKPKEEKKAEAKGAESGAAKGKKAKGAKRPAPGDGWLAWLQWQYAQARQAVVKAWRRFVKWVRGLFGL